MDLGDDLPEKGPEVVNIANATLSACNGLLLDLRFVRFRDSTS
jgi:hypothetical protein